MSLCRAAAGWAKQIPRHIKNPCSCGTQAHFKYCAPVCFPAVRQRVGPDALERQVISMIQKIFEACQQRAVCALTDHDLTQGLEARPALWAESTRTRDFNHRSPFISEAVIDAEGLLK